MHYSLDYVQVSDESLFILMTQGNKMASTILLNRYEHLGRQIAGVHIRTECLRGYTDEDFIEVIHDSIAKAFRYYQLNQTRFATFCRNIITQNIVSRVKEIKLEMAQRQDTISLDDYDEANQRENHDLIGDNQLSMADYCDLNEFIENMSSSTNPNVRLYSKVITLYSTDMTIKEISEKLGISVYQVRKIINDAPFIMDGINFKF